MKVGGEATMVTAALPNRFNPLNYLDSYCVIFLTSLVNGNHGSIVSCNIMTLLKT